MPEEMADSGRKLVTLDDLIDALDKRERAPSNVPKVETFHFKGDRVSDWLDLTEQALVGLSDEVKLQRVLRYVLHSHHREVTKVVDAASGIWAKFGDLMRRKYRLGDGLLTMADFEAMNKEDFSTIGAFVHEFKKKARKVHGISEEAQCATFLGLLTGSEATELTKRKRKERDATGSGTPGVKRIVTDVLAALGYDNEAEIQKRGVLVAQGRASGAVDEEAGQEDYGGGETGSQVRDQPSIAMVDTGAEMNIIRERDATMLGLEVDHSDHGMLHGANCKAIFCGTTSNVMVKIGRVRARTCLFVMPDVDHPILLGRSFLCRTETLVFNRHEGTMILALSDPACEIIKCRNTRPETGRNRLNLGSFTFEESEYARWRLREEQEEEAAGEVLSLSLIDVNKAMEVVAAHDMADPKAIKALREQDLQRLNAVTVRDAGGLPNADALLESCAGRPIISPIDLYSGYDQFPVYPPDRPVTAMHTPRGLIHMNVAPQGWTNEVAMVQRLMIRAMQTVSPHITQPYIDDLAVKGPKEKREDEVTPGVRRFVWKHIQDIDQVLGLLEEHNLMASALKSKHCMRQATILGFVCNEKGRRPDVKKTNKILEWPVLFQSITDVRSFLGTCGFWRSFVKDFASKTEHLRKLVRKDQEWVWGEDQEKAVERMKRIQGMRLGAGGAKLRGHGGEAIRCRDGRRTNCLGRGPDSGRCGWERKTVKIDVIAALHYGIAGGHRGVSATCEKINELYHWDGILTMVIKYCQSCVPCQQRSAQRPGKLLHPKLEREEGAVVHLDLLFMPLGEDRSNYIFDAQDNLTGFVDGRAIRTKTSPVLARCIEEYYLRYPFVREFVMDRGSEFTCNEVRTLLAGYDVVANYTTVAHPQANAPVERGHSTITNLLAKWTEGKPNQCPKFLRASFFVENVTVKRTTKSDFSKAVMQRGGRDTRPCQGPQRMEARGEQNEPPRREPMPEFDDDNIELFLDVYRDHAAQRGWSVAERIHHLRGVGRFQEPVAQICKEALTWPDVEAGMQRLRASPRGRDGMPIRLEEGNADEFIPAYEHYMLSLGVAREEWVQALLIWTRQAERQVAKQIRERARDWEDCQAQLRRVFGRPQHERHEPRVERRRRSKRPREPAPREAGLARERRGAPAQREDEPAGPALAEESFPACGLRAVEFRRITSEELRPPSPLPSTQELDIPRETPFRSLATHLDVSQWEASRLGEGSVEPACYVPLEEPLDPEMETDMRDEEEPQDPEMAAERPDPVRPQGREVITVGDDTPPCSPAPEPAQRLWPEGIPEPGSEEIPESSPAAAITPEQEAEAEDRGVCERARVEAPFDLPSATQVTKNPDIEEPVSAELPPVVSCASEGMEAEASTPGAQRPRVEGTPKETREEKSARVRVRLDEIHARQAEMEAAGIEPTPPVEPKTSEQRIDELWARYESQRDAARQRSREEGRADEETSELREMGDLGFSATRQAIERMGRRIGQAGVDGEGRGMRASPSQGAAVEVPRQSEPMEEVPLDAVEEEGRMQESLMAMSTERRGSHLHELAAAMGIGTPQERPQGLDAPEQAPRLGELRVELGFWATETNSGGLDSQQQQQQEVMSEPTTM
ncbi:hypothetical protein CBR_g51248, partial [Chara braunii]